MMLFEIYIIRNSINDSVYIGQTKSSKGYKKRFKEHLYEATVRNRKTHLYNAIRLYGKENFYVNRVLHDIPEEKINFYEILLIEKYRKTHKMYNQTLGGGGVRGHIFSDIQLKKISDGVKKYWKDMKENNIDEYKRLC